MSKKTNNKYVFKISNIIFLITLLISIILGIMLIISNIIPNKYLYIVIGILSIIYIAYILCFIFKKKTLTIILNVITIILATGEVIAMLTFQSTIDFIKQNFGKTKVSYTYNLVANKSSEANNICDITTYYYKDLDDDSKLMDKINENNCNKDIKSYDGNVYDLLNSVVKDKRTALVSSAFYEVMIENDSEYEGNTKVIATYTIEADEEEHKVEKNITNESFLLFINGIDTRSGKMPARSLSDVNILMAVNPVKKEILMVATPRDYYVQLHGTKGLKDKLTHSGTFGGVKSTMATLEDLYDLKIDHYIRVNFNMVIRLVDAIGGITLYNDQNYNITCHTNSSCVFKPGNNNVDGKCALAFARERKSYATGDKHRGENQEQVISKVFEKITSSSTLINDYSKILKALDGTFETSLEEKDITSLIKMQINDMAKWKISQYNVSGAGSMEYTYSYPKQKLWVMFEDKKTIETAKEKINEVLNK